MMGFGMGFGLIGLVLMVLFWGGLFSFFARLFGGANGQMNLAAGSGPRPREILDQRYARGEISREEYERMKQDLL